MLSAKAEGSDRVLGLEAGADDYLVEPFYQQELLARVRVLLRRYHDLGYASKAHILDSEYIVIDPGHDAGWERLAAMLEKNGYIRSDTEDIPILIYRKSLQ